MNELMNGAYGGAIVIWAIIMMVSMVIWFFVPFAIFGTKKRIKQAIDMQITQLEVLTDIRRILVNAQEQHKAERRER
jgi:hypothetical protein